MGMVKFQENWLYPLNYLCFKRIGGLTVSDVNKLAEKIINQGKKSVCRELPPFIRAINALKFKLSERECNYTNGNDFYYSPQDICKKYKTNKNNIPRLLLHSLLHCSLLHIYNTDFRNKKLWNLACDMCVEKIINDAKLSCSQTEKSATQNSVIKHFSDGIKNFTAENIYYYLTEKKLSTNDIELYADLFLVDHHKTWYENALFSINDDDDPTEIEARSIYKQEDDRNGESQNGGKTLSKFSNANAENSQDAWREITKQIIRDLDVFPSQMGSNFGEGIQIFESVTREEYDYSDLLKRFIETDETLEINDDEFDYIYYTYGLKLYENIPLIEPLEYAESGKINKLVIAIDTSGSVKGEIVEGFIRKTYSILNSTDFFKKSSEIHIIQCDATIQDVVIIKTPLELEDYINNLVLHGFGGTNFTPVFQYVDELYEKNSKKELNGLIYFTDGDGIYPEKTPLYKNVFIIHDNGFSKKRLPLWATPLYIDKNKLITL